MRGEEARNERMSGWEVSGWGEGGKEVGEEKGKDEEKGVSG